MSVTNVQDHERPAPRSEALAPTVLTDVPVAADPQPVAGLMVGRADATAEQDADALADRALRRLDSGAATGAGDDGAGEPHAHGAGCGHLRRSAQATPGAAVGFEGGALDASTSALIESRRGGGSTLPTSVRRSMETAFGTGLGHVRVHDDPVAANLNRTVSAAAFTTGADIFFGAGQYAPDDAAGRQVLAHEIAHVVTEGPGTSVRRFFSWFKRNKPAKEDDHSKALEKTEKVDLAAARDEGEKGRAAIKDEAYSGDGSQAPATLQKLNALFAEALAEEKTLLSLIKKEHAADPEWTDDHSIEMAYQLTWLEGKYAAQLASVAPPRKTASERLLIAVRRARTNASVRATMSAEAELGSMLPKGVEAIYEQYVAKVDALVAAKTHTPDTAAAEAEALVWATADPKLISLRPARNSPLDVKALADARRRIPLRPPPKPQPKRLERADAAVDDAIEKSETPLERIGNIGSAIAAVGTIKETDFGALGAADVAQAADRSGISEFVTETQGAMERVRTGERSEEESDSVEIIEAQVAGGISTVTGVFSGLLGSASATLKFVKALNKAMDDPSPRKALAAAKAGFDGLTTLTDTAKDTAGLAQLISPGVAASVAKVIPGLNIVTAITGLGSSVMTLADSALRMDEANTAVFDARTRTPNAKTVDVMVRPMLQVSERFTKNLEQASWSTGVAVSELVTSIATIASAGGFGIPSAVQAGVSALDTLHSLGHFIADQILARIAKSLQGESTGRLEGAAENQMRSNSGIAVDGIIMRGVQGDKIAQAFLANYEVDGETVTPAMLAKLRLADDGELSDENVHAEESLVEIREAVLAAMGTTADPEYFYESWQDKIGSVMEKWGDTGELAEKRNALDNPTGAAGVEPARGLAWRLKMMLKTEEKLGRSKKKTDARRVDAVPTESILVQVGNAVLPSIATEKQVQAFVAELETMPDAQIVAAANAPDIADAARELLLKFVQDRLAKAAAGTGAP